MSEGGVGISLVSPVGGLNLLCLHDVGLRFFFYLKSVMLISNAGE